MTRSAKAKQAAAEASAKAREQQRTEATRKVLAMTNHPVVKAALHAAEIAEVINAINVLVQQASTPDLKP